MNRRELLVLAALTACARHARAEALPLLSESEPHAKELKYVEDARRGADPGHTCASCALYQGVGDAPTGPCTLFPGHLVKAAGSCASWAPQI